MASPALRISDLYPDDQDLFGFFVARFWGRVEERSSSECWPWRGSRTPFGYGRIRVRLAGGRETVVYAHRLSYLFCHGDIPEGLYVMHSCDRPPCTNPEHLFLGTAKDNALDREAKGRGGTKGVRGEDHPSAKLTWAGVLEMRRLKEEGAAVADLAARFGVSQSAAYAAISGRTWREDRAAA